MKSTFRHIKTDSIWAFKHSTPAAIVKVFEINKTKTEYRVGKKIIKRTDTEIIYGTRKSVSGHICQSIKGFLENYEWRKNA